MNSNTPNASSSKKTKGALFFVSKEPPRPDGSMDPYEALGVFCSDDLPSHMVTSKGTPTAEGMQYAMEQLNGIPPKPPMGAEIFFGTIMTPAGLKDVALFSLPKESSSSSSATSSTMEMPSAPADISMDEHGVPHVTTADGVAYQTAMIYALEKLPPDMKIKDKVVTMDTMGYLALWFMRRRCLWNV